jgi:hypothetical protein
MFFCHAARQYIINLSDWVQDGTALIPFSQPDRSGRGTTPGAVPSPLFDGLTFYVKNFPIVVHRLGLWRPLLDSLDVNTTATVGLRNRRTNELLFHVTFGAVDRGGSAAAPGGGPESGYAFARTPNKKSRDLPANFEGVLQLRLRNATGGRLPPLHTRSLKLEECVVQFHHQLGNPGIFIITGNNFLLPLFYMALDVINDFDAGTIDYKGPSNGFARIKVITSKRHKKVTLVILCT